MVRPRSAAAVDAVVLPADEGGADVVPGRGRADAAADAVGGLEHVYVNARGGQAVGHPQAAGPAPTTTTSPMAAGSSFDNLSPPAVLFSGC